MNFFIPKVWPGTLCILCPIYIYIYIAFADKYTYKTREKKNALKPVNRVLPLVLLRVNLESRTDSAVPQW